MSDTQTPCTGQWRLFDADHLGDVQAAKALCGLCPRRDACLLKALRFELRAPAKERHGVWGGLSREERHQIATKGTGHPDAHRLRHLALGVAAADCARCTSTGQQVAA